jgi:UDP-N-acetylmuramoyl-tripeptide--D-alanyl-D-alanine ligase
MIHMTLLELATHLGVTESHPEVTFTGVSTDTRTIQPGNLFVAIVGEQFDGHQFVETAFQKGAAALLVSQPINPDIPHILVNDTVDALGKMSSLWRNYFSLPIIGVTGSNGKTTLKNMIASILQAACHGDASQVLATKGNLNNYIGLPLTLLELNANHRYGVVEMGMNHLGEIAYLTQLAKPHIAVITNAAESHLEGLNDVAGVARAKGEIFLGLPKNGIAILNRDDVFFDYWRELDTEHRYWTFGLNHPADISAIIIDHQATHQMITLLTPVGKMDVKLPLLGTHNVMNALAATAATLALNLDLMAIKTGLENMHPAPGRLNQHVLPTGVRIIDDTYNANPFSLNAAIHALSVFQGKKILVLGDMKELGPHAKDMHAAAGKSALSAGIDYLFTFGELSAAATESFGKNAQHFTDRDKLLQALLPLLQSGNTVLIKGSRSMKMEKVVAQLVPSEHLSQTH